MTKDCELWIQSRGTLNPDQKQFGSFLRDAPFQAGGKNAFFVPGIFDRAGKNFKKQKQRDEDEGVSPEVGLAHNVPMDKQAARVCIDDEDSFEESSVSKNKQMIESFNEETKTAINPKNSSHPKFTPQINRDCILMRVILFPNLACQISQRISTFQGISNLKLSQLLSKIT